MDLTDYLRILRSRWLIVFATAIVAVVAAWATSSGIQFTNGVTLT